MRKILLLKSTFSDVQQRFQANNFCSLFNAKYAKLKKRDGENKEMRFKGI
jgi:hypothetical protein